MRHLPWGATIPGGGASSCRPTWWRAHGGAQPCWWRAVAAVFLLVDVFVQTARASRASGRHPQQGATPTPVAQSFGSLAASIDPHVLPGVSSSFVTVWSACWLPPFAGACQNCCPTFRYPERDVPQGGPPVFPSRLIPPQMRLPLLSRRSPLGLLLCSGVLAPFGPTAGGMLDQKFRVEQHPPC